MRPRPVAPVAEQPRTHVLRPGPRRVTGREPARVDVDRARAPLQDVLGDRQALLERLADEDRGLVGGLEPGAPAGHALRLVARRRDERDRRNVIIQRTVDGALYLDRLADLIVAKAGEVSR